jgi:hypothetical protein
MFVVVARAVRTAPSPPIKINQARGTHAST